LQRGRLLLALLLLAGGGGRRAWALAQAPALSVTVATEPATARVQTERLLADGKYVGLLRSGFPLRLRYRLELWRVRSTWFDQLVKEASWEAVVRNDPLADDFVLLRTGGATTRYATAEELGAALAIPYRVTLPPRGSGRFYFVCRLEVTTLNDSDLRELSNWLRGEVSPAVSGEGNFGDALVRGAQRALVRIAGLPKLTLEARSAEFRPGG
jgi:hypothetical protein